MRRLFVWERVLNVATFLQLLALSAALLPLGLALRAVAQDADRGFLGGINLDLSPNRPLAVRLSGNPAASDLAALSACPVAEDDLVIVEADRPAEIHLPVANLGDGDVTIFQHPLGGLLHAAGPSLLDYVFIPDSDFRGSTTLVYRVTPAGECPDSFLLGTVTLAVGAGATSLDLGGRVSVALCGIGFASPLLAAAMLLGLSRIRRRR